MRRLTRSIFHLLGAVAFVTCTHSSFAAEQVGSLPGQFDVSAKGAGTFRIPIKLNAATGGLQPSISLAYNHRGGNGVAGQKWTLQGISRIDRCPKTLAQDNEIRGVRYDSDDRFCLDGQRPVAISGTYGANGTQYRTEIETFRKIVSHGSVGGGPVYFTVTDPDGRNHSYGNVQGSSYYYTGTGAAQFWARYRTEDQFHNEINYFYTGTASIGEFLLDKIEYTSNPTEGLSARYRVAMTYENRPASDQRSGYRYGAVWSSTKRLSKIAHTLLGTGGGTIRDYNLAYSTGTTGRSQLTAVDLAVGADHLPDSTFSWQNATAGWASIQSTGNSSTAHTYPKYGDFNGDGQQDVLVVQGGTWRILFASNGTLLAPSNTSKSAQNPSLAVVTDFDGDGKTDLLFPGTDLKWHVYLSTGTGFTDINTGESTVSQTNGVAQDVDGDGRGDLLYKSGNSIYLRKSVGNDLATSATVVFSHNDLFSFSMPNRTVMTSPMADLNGDGRGDINATMQIGSTFPVTYEQLPLVFTGSVYGSLIGGFPSISNSFYPPRFVDINGDGLDDIVYVTGSQWAVRISTGKGVGSETLTGITGSLLQKVDFADYDQDGRRDLIIADSSTWKVHKSNGTSFNSTAVSISGMTSSQPPVAMDIDGDANDEWLVNSSNYWRIGLHNSAHPDVVTKFTDGFGNTVEPDYEPISTSSRYIQYYQGSPPTDQNYRVPLHVVTDYTVSDGIGGSYTNKVYYWGSKRNLKGRGFLGFRQIREYDYSGSGYRMSRRLYRQDFPYVGRLEWEETWIDNWSNRSAKLDPAWYQSTDYSGVYFVRASSTTHYRFQIGGPDHAKKVRKTVDDPSFDETYGNVTKRVITTTSDFAIGDTYKTTIDYTRSNLTGPWCLSLPTQVKVTREAPGATTQVRTMNNTFDPGNCALLTSTDASMASTADQLKATLTYDGYGNVKTVTEDNANGTAADRKTEYFFDTDGQLPTSIKRYVDSYTDPTTSIVWDYKHTKPLSVEDARGQKTSWTYDMLGRLASETRPDSTGNTTSYSKCTAPCTFSEGVMSIKTEASANSFERSDFLDSYGRPVGGWRSLPTGESSKYRIDYDQQGRVDKRYLPWVDGEPSFFVQMDYDIQGRLVEADRPISETTTSGAITTISYSGLDYTVTNAESQDTEYRHDPLGRLEKVIDELNGETEYEYTSFDQLHKTWDPGNALTTINYNERGDKISMIVPDMDAPSCNQSKSVTFGYNVFGDMTSRKDAKCQTATFTFNQLGLPKTRVESEGTTTWSYYTSNDHKLWLPSGVTSPGGVSEAYSFDTLSRASQITTTVDSIGYQIDLDYHASGDGKGQLKRITYPTSTSGVRFKADYDYDSWGYTEKVKNGDSPGTVYYQLNETDALGRERLASFGNGMDEDRAYDRANGFLKTIRTGPNLTATIQDLSFGWDMLGNLTSRLDNNQGKTEALTYDGLSRLKTAKLNGVQSVTLNYLANGNISYKSDVGTYSYSGNVHAVSSITGTRPGSYEYDENGNMDVRAGKAITWTSHNKPDKVNYGTSDFAEFLYGADRQRVKQVAKTGSSTVTTIYIAGLLEKETVGSTTQYKHNIRANGQTVAIYTRPTAGSTNTRYVHRDHMNSVVALTNGSGSLVQSYSFDAFGKRRNTDWSADTSDSQFTVSHKTERGYTGHEHLDNVQLTHMNGRVQDPIIGRMISSDSYVPHAMNGQSFNRFSYVRNNPLSLIDPTGFIDDDGPANPNIDVCQEIGGCGPFPIVPLPGDSEDSIVENPYDDGTGAPDFDRWATDPGWQYPSGTLTAYVDRTPNVNSQTALGSYVGAAVNAFIDLLWGSDEEFFQGMVEGSCKTGCDLDRHVDPNLVYYQQYTVNLFYYGSIPTGTGATAIRQGTAPAERGAGAVTKVANVTAAGSRYANLATNLTAREFQANLLSNSYRIVRQTTGANGPVTILSNGQKTYTIYTATSTGSASAQVTNAAGDILSKIRLGGF
ncbi:MAG TPA: FG-GAP-like repeat-containing protein [Woeseiaceae bacterium]|nr:FG-GAP-like repeat-containing protein [Woeseiaceae bacterium]